MLNKHFRLRRNVKFIDKSLKTIGLSNIPQEITNLVESRYREYESNHGTKIALKMLSSVYTDFICLKTGKKIKPDSPIWMKRDKDGFPSSFKSIKKFVENDFLPIATLLRSYESIELPAEDDISSVTDVTGGNESWVSSHSESFRDFLNRSTFGRFIKKLYISEAGKLTQKNKDGYGLHFTTKQGPLGPSCSCAGAESSLIDNESIDLLSKLADNFGLCYKAMVDFGVQDYEKYIFSKVNFREILEINKEYYSRKREDLYPKCKSPESFPFTGKIVNIPAKGGKTRTIAMGNYWYQEVLLQLHKIIYRMLRRVPNDCTYDQGKLLDEIKQLTSDGKDIWSFDLSKATDKFPIAPQVEVLNHLQPGLGRLWNDILKSIKFSYNAKPVSYATGQPMGLYSSWAVFTLTHHTIIQYCAWLNRSRIKRPTRQYAVLGDDVSIWNQQIARKYEELIPSLKVEISERKSFTPEDFSRGSISEFAKRIIFRGEEITPISPNIILRIRNSLELLVFLQYLSQRKYIPLSGVPASKLIKDNFLITYRNRKRKSFLFNLFGAAWIWQVLTGSQLIQFNESERITDGGLPHDIRNISKELILKTCSDIMFKQFSLINDTIFNVDETEKGKLDERLGRDIPYFHYSHMIIQKRIRHVNDLADEKVPVLTKDLSDLIGGFGFGTPINLPVVQDVKDEVDMQDIEYLPTVDVAKFLIGENRYRTRQYQRFVLLSQVAKNLVDKP